MNEKVLPAPASTCCLGLWRRRPGLVSRSTDKNARAREGPALVSCGLGSPPPPLAPVELPPAAAPGPFSALSPTRFILDDSALYLSDKCEVETLDLRRGGQGPGGAPSP